MIFATRFHEGDDLKQSITDFVQAKKLTNASIVSAVRSLSKVQIRMAGAKPTQQATQTFEGEFEVVSLVGTIDGSGKPHLHISFSDTDGKVVGGHLKNGCIVHTTVELVVISGRELVFSRQVDEKTGFEELVVRESI